MKKFKKTAVLALTAAIAFAFAGCAEKQKSPYDPVKSGDVIINEVASSNSGSYTTESGETPDWIEVKNVSGKTLDLNGCSLSDSIKNLKKFVFGECVLGPDEYAVVICNKTADDGPMTAKFGISSDGEKVFLTAPSAGVISTADVPALESDTTWAMLGDGYAVSTRPTPGGDNKEGYDSSAEAKLYINEYMTENDCCPEDSFGKRTSWAEIKNGGFEPVQLGSFFLSDKSSDAKKWRFPDVELMPGETLLIHLSGRNVNENGEIHASFKLSADDDVLYIADETGFAIDKVEYPVFNDGKYSVGRTGGAESEFAYFAKPTPGKENGTLWFSDAESAEKYLPEVYISEVKSAGDTYDWVEIANRSANDVSLAGWGFSDKGEELYRYTFADTVVPAGGYAVIELRNGEDSPAFGIKRATETVYLTDSEGFTVDEMSSGVQNDSISCGRKGDSNERFFFETPTKGEANDSAVLTGYASAPVFSRQGGYAEKGTKVELTAKEGERIYYTLDGSKPSESSTLYNAPITVDSTSCIRAVSYADGKLASPVVTENYLVGVTHEVPVVFVDMDPEDFDGETRGIYAKGEGYYRDEANNTGFIHQNANYWQDWEREMNFTFYEKDGTKGVSFDAGIKIFGQYSREEKQKSFSVHLRGKYGQKSVTYPFFRDCDITSFKSFILRTSGQDWKKTKIIDALTAQTVKGYTNVDIMEYRPCVLYINGEYWGIYNIREKENENYVVSHYGDDGAEKGNIDMIKGDRNQQAGDRTDWMDLRKYVVQYLPWYGQPNKTNTKEFMNHIEERIDIDSLIDWLCIEAYFGNTDTGNLREMRYNGGKWRWMLFDMDWSLQAGSEYSPNYLAELFNNDGHGSNNLFWAHLHMMIFYNDTWREKFITRYAYLLNNVFDTDRVCTLIDAMAAEIRPEMGRNIEKWGVPASVDKWEELISTLKGSAGKRRSQAVKELKSVFGLSDSRINELFPNG